MRQRLSQRGDLVILCDEDLFICFKRADRVKYGSDHRTPVIHDVQQLVAAEPLAVAGSLQNDRYLRLIRLQCSPGALYPHDGEYLLQPVGRREPVRVIIDLIHEHAEFTTHAFLPAFVR